MQTAILSVLIAVGLVFLAVSFGEAMDTNIDSNNKMLCESALKSHNLDYLKKCQVYYQTGQLDYLR